MRVIALGPGIQGAISLLLGVALLMYPGHWVGYLLIGFGLMAGLALWIERLSDKRSELETEKLVSRLARFAQAFAAIQRLYPEDLGDGSIVIDKEAWDEMEAEVCALIEGEELPEVGDAAVVPEDMH